MNQWTKVARILEWVNNYGKEYKEYNFWYKNNHELKFNIGKYIYLLSYNNQFSEISLQIFNDNRECIFRYFTYITIHYHLTLGCVLQGIIEAFIVGRGENEKK